MSLYKYTKSIVWDSHINEKWEVSADDNGGIILQVIEGTNIKQEYDITSEKAELIAQAILEQVNISR